MAHDEGGEISWEGDGIDASAAQKKVTRQPTSLHASLRRRSRRCAAALRARTLPDPRRILAANETSGSDLTSRSHGPKALHAAGHARMPIAPGPLPELGTVVADADALLGIHTRHYHLCQGVLRAHDGAAATAVMPPVYRRERHAADVAVRSLLVWHPQRAALVQVRARAPTEKRCSWRTAATRATRRRRCTRRPVLWSMAPSAVRRGARRTAHRMTRSRERDSSPMRAAARRGAREGWSRHHGWVRRRRSGSTGTPRLR